MELLSGKNNTNFKAWYIVWQEDNDYWKPFHKLPFNMQEGVLKAYYRTIGYYPDVTNPFTSTNFTEDNNQYHSICETGDSYYPIDFHDSYEEASIKSLEITNELVNDWYESNNTKTK